MRQKKERSDNRRALPKFLLGLLGAALGGVTFGAAREEVMAFGDGDNDAGMLELAGVIVAIRVYQRPGSPTYKLAWMCLLLALPVSGMLLFCLWGGTHQAKSLSLRQIPPIPLRHGQHLASEKNLAQLRRQSPAWGRLAAYLQKRGFILCGPASSPVSALPGITGGQDLPSGGRLSLTYQETAPRQCVAPLRPRLTRCHG